MECIILAGGFGTRLRDTIGEYPKCMAPVNGTPFLHYLFRYLAGQGCQKVILSLGYKSEVVISWLHTQQLPFACEWVTEQQPMGTGGGLALALQKTKEDHIAVFNGDTFFRVDIQALFDAHTNKRAVITVALKFLYRFERYGTVLVSDDTLITDFGEKKFQEQGWINGGVYIIDRLRFLSRDMPSAFSLEMDYLEAFVQEHNFYGKKATDYFIDIGIPEDYRKVQMDFKTLFG